MRLLKNVLTSFLPYNSTYKRFCKAKLASNYLDFLKFKLGLSKRYWPAHKNCTIGNFNKLFIGKNALIGRPGNYIQGAGKVYIGNYVQFGPNVGVLSSNHDLYDQRIAVKKEVVIGNYSWVGMNSVILPGVVLGTRTIVASGSVVTKSFPDGYCVIGGTPAKLIKELDKSKFLPWTDEHEFYGFVPRKDFETNDKYKPYFIEIKKKFGL